MTNPIDVSPEIDAPAEVGRNGGAMSTSATTRSGYDPTADSAAAAEVAKRADNDQADEDQA
ncbi:MAG: hypothetical protein EOP58_06315 [Sphingomonadales bacterium]|nr:MAG: hypothetical protein EOP58_06315 [Sphingomonadales bacterium]